MEAGGALCEIRECLSRAFLVTKNVQIKNRAHTVHFFVQRRGESFTGRKTQAKCESSQSFRFLRNRVGLLLSFDLQTMLNTPEKPIRLVERQNFIVRKKIQLAKTPQRFKHARFLQERMARPVDELK